MNVDELPHYVFALAIVAMTIFSALIIEALSYFTLYKTSEYQRSSQRVEELSRKFELEKNAVVSLDKKKLQEKKLERLEDDLKAASNDMQKGKWKLNLFMSMFYFLLYRLVSFLFYGKVVALLPFDPFPMIRGMTHRGVPGDDFYQCSFAFIYTLSTVALKGNIQTLLGFAPPRSAYDPMARFKKEE